MVQVTEVSRMGHRCCSKQKVKRGLWSPEEDEKLIRHITTHGHACWSSVPKLAGLQRCGKSCRLRWINYLRPDLKRGTFTAHEEQIIIDVHRILGNRWAQIAKHLPGRTDNEVKNFWNSCIKKKLISKGLDPKTHNLISSNSSHRQQKKHYPNDHKKSGGTGSARNINPPQSQANLQPMISVFTVVDNSQPQVRTTARDNNSKQVLNPLFAVLPEPITPHINPDQPHHQTMPIPMPTTSELLYQYDQNSTSTSTTTNSVWTLNKDDDDQNNSYHHHHHHQDDFINEFPCGGGSSNIGNTSLTSSSSCSVNPAAGFCLSSIDGNSIWPGTSTSIGEPFGSAGQEPLPLQLQNPLHKEKINIQQQLDANGNPKSDHHMELDTPTFDSSTFDLLQFVDSNLSSIDDLTWNF